MTLFDSKRLLVRRFTEADADAFFEINGNQQVMQYIRPAKTLEQSNAFLQENLHLYKNGSCLGRFAVVEKDSQLIAGTFSFLYLAGEADFHIGYALLPWAWGKGYATELVHTGTEYFFANTTYTALFAITAVANIASRKVLEKTGFQFRENREEHGEMLDIFFLNRS